MLRWKSSLKPAAAAAADYKSTVLADSPLFYYRLGESSGTTAYNEVTASSDGTYYNTPTLSQTGAISGDSNTSVLFEEANQESARTTILSSETSLLPCTIECFVKCSGGSDNNAGIVFIRGTTPASGLNIAGSTLGKLGYHWRGQSNTYFYDPGITLSDNTWYYVALVVESTKATFYVIDESGTLTTATNSVTHAAIDVSANRWHIARDPTSSRYFQGYIDEVAVYDQALSQSTLVAHAAAAGFTAAAAWSPLDEASLDSYWDPTDESSITGSPAVTTLEDLGPNGNDLSANGTPQTGVRTINSLNVIDFDGVNEYLSNSTYTLNSTVTFVGVFLVDVNGSNVNESILSVDATVDFQIDSGDGGSDWDGRLNPTGTGSVTSWSDSNSKNGVAMIVSVTFDAVANTIDVWYDGDNMVSLSNYTTDLDGTQDLKIMGNRNGSYTANGAFGGMAIFNSANTDIRQNAEGFFAERFALTGNLVSGHPYSTAASYVYEEDFEGTGTPTGFTTSISGSGTVDYDHTTNVLEGSKSLQVYSDSDTYAYLDLGSEYDHIVAVFGYYNVGASNRTDVAFCDSSLTRDATNSIKYGSASGYDKGLKHGYGNIVLTLTGTVNTFHYVRVEIDKSGGVVKIARSNDKTSFPTSGTNYAEDLTASFHSNFGGTQYIAFGFQNIVKTSYYDDIEVIEG